MIALVTFSLLSSYIKASQSRPYSQTAVNSLPFLPMNYALSDCPSLCHNPTNSPIDEILPNFIVSVLQDINILFLIAKPNNSSSKTNV
jgi:hypothetical protein